MKAKAYFFKNRFVQLSSKQFRRADVNYTSVFFDFFNVCNHTHASDQAAPQTASTDRGSPLPLQLFANSNSKHIRRRGYAPAQNFRNFCLSVPWRQSGALHRAEYKKLVPLRTPYARVADKRRRRCRDSTDEVEIKRAVAWGRYASYTRSGTATCTAFFPQLSVALHTHCSITHRLVSGWCMTRRRRRRRVGLRCRRSGLQALRAGRDGGRDQTQEVPHSPGPLPVRAIL